MGRSVGGLDLILEAMYIRVYEYTISSCFMFTAKQRTACRKDGDSSVNDPELRKKADLLKVLGNPTRLAILEELRMGAKCVSDIEDLLEIRQANVSQHLVILRREGLVDFHEDGNLRCYYLTKPGLVTALVRFLTGDYRLKTRSAVSIRREGKKRREKCADECN